MKLRTASALAAVLVLVVAGAAGGARERRGGGWIVFSTPAPGNGGQIISAPLAGGRQRILTGGLLSAPTLALSPDGKLIAFVREGRGGPSIWLVRADGGRLRRLTPGAHPAWSPDGRRLAFFRVRGHLGLMTIRRDGSGVRQLVDGAHSYGGEPPAWSADGDRIAYPSQHDQLSVVRSDGRGAHPVANLESSLRGSYSWSPNGRRLAYVGIARAGATVQHDIYTVSFMGGGARRLTRTPDEDFAPQWSPDGRRIAFWSESGITRVVRADGSAPARRVTRGTSPSWSPDSSKLAVVRGYSMWVVRADGRQPRRVGRGTASASIVDARAVWTPDARRIFFSRQVIVPDELTIVSANGGPRRRLTHNRISELEPAWSPNGRMLAFTGVLDEEGAYEQEIYVVRADGRGMRRLTRRRGSDSEPTWSRDGKRIAFVRRSRTEVAIYVVPLSGGTPTRIVSLSSPAKGHPAWAPGRWIGVDGIDLYTPTGKPAGRLTQPPGSDDDAELDWAPDGRRFAFTRIVNLGCGQCDVPYLAVGRLGSASVNQTNAAVTSPSWSPDGSRIAAVVYGEGKLVTMRPDGTGRRVVAVGLPDEGAEIDWGPAR